jgi:serine/threonine protein kinase
MHPPADGCDPEGVAQVATPDWEAFYRDYRKPGYIEGFEVTSKLGGGMFGLVFRARRMSIGKDYAIKFLKVDDGEVRRAVLSELEQVKYFAQIDHPNLVSIEDRGEVNGIPFLIMAFAGTETLRDMMTASGIGEGQVPKGDKKDELVQAFLQSCRGLHALHERSLVHFDIKPANVFLKGGVARLGDYGLSKLITHSRGSLSMGRGTPYYMAPEMLQRRGDVRSDIYSLGVMLYEILCGKLPFTGENEWEVLRKHETAHPDLPKHLTPIERRVLRRCLAKDAEARFQSVEELLAEFGPLSRIDGMPVESMDLARAAALSSLSEVPPVPPPVPPPLPMPSPRARRPAAVGGAALPRRPASRRSRNRNRSRSPNRGESTRLSFGFKLAVCVFVLSASLVYLLFVGVKGAQRVSNDTAILKFQEARMQALSAVHEAVNQEAAKVFANGLRAAQHNRPQDLRGLDFDRVEIPDDYSAYLEMLDPLAKAAQFVPALATRVQQLGRPAMVAAVATLQELNYEDVRECQIAVNLQRLLVQMTGIKTLVVKVDGVQPSAREICMFHAVADGWRVIAERYAATDRQYAELLGVSRSVGSPVEATSPR